MRAVGTDVTARSVVPWSVCLSVLDTNVQKRLNGTRCRLADGLVWIQGNAYWTVYMLTPSEYD